MSMLCLFLETSHAKMAVCRKLELGGQVLEVELAQTEMERCKGLKHRDVLDEGRGMLFVFDCPTRCEFWMEATSIALDIGFFDEDAVLMEVMQLYPHDLTPKGPKKYFQYALEVNQGWFKRYGVKPGQRLVLKN